MTRNTNNVVLPRQTTCSSLTLEVGACVWKFLMAAEIRKSRSIKIKPIILRKAHVRAIESQKRLGQWLEEAIEEKTAREEREEQKGK